MLLWSWTITVDCGCNVFSRKLKWEETRKHHLRNKETGSGRSGRLFQTQTGQEISTCGL